MLAPPWPAPHASAAPRPPRPRRAPAASAAPASRPIGGGDGAASAASAALFAACAEAGVRVESPAAEDAFLWDDDYLDVVAEADDGWGRDQFGGTAEPVGELGDDAAGSPFAPPAGDEQPPPPDAYAQLQPLSAAALVAALRAPHGARPVVVDVSPQSEGDDSDADAAAASPGPPRVLRVPLAGLARAAREGALGGRGGAAGAPAAPAVAGPVAVARVDAGGRALARQAAVRLRAVLGFGNAAACDASLEEVLRLMAAEM